jgi:hypothetical protein
MSVRLGLFATVFAMLGYTACGYPDFRFVDNTSDGGGGNTTTTAPTTSTNASGGTGGNPGCNLGQVGVCGDGMKCTVINPDTGEIGCHGAGPRGAYSRCEDDLECVDGTFCDLQLRTCKPFCQSGNDCEMGAQCYPAAKAGGGDVPGLKLCTAHCHPTNGGPCDSTNGPVTCYYDVTRAEFDCAATINLQELASCDLATDCATGLGCVGSAGNGVCRMWCTPINSACPFFPEICNALNPAVMYAGQEYGVCG